MRWDMVAVVGFAVGLFAVLGEHVAAPRPAPCSELAVERTHRSDGPVKRIGAADLAAEQAGDTDRVEAFGADMARSHAFIDGSAAAPSGGGSADPAPTLRTTVPDGDVGVSDHAATRFARTTALPLAVFTLGTVLVGLGLSRHRLDV
jgi:hypothetical protein